MFPLVAIGGAIGAAFSLAKGAAWLAEQLDSSNAGSSVGAKGEAQPVSEAQAAQFEAALAAQVAGQKAPVSTAAPVSLPPTARGPDHDTLDRMKAGILAYSHIGERRDDQARPPPATGEDRPLIRS